MSSIRGFLLSVLLLLASFAAPYTCDPWASAETACEVASRTTPVTGIVVEPDDGYRPIVAELDAATCAIDVSVYLLSDSVVVDALVAAQFRGVSVRVQIEEHPFGGSATDSDETLAILDRARIPWRFTPARFRFSHAKYMVIDAAVGIVMNQNLTSSAFYDNREFAVITTDPTLVDELEALFEADWSDRPVDLADSTLVLSPDNARTTIDDAITGATGTLDMYAEVIRDDAIVGLLTDAVARGVNVRVLVNTTIDDLDFGIYTQLERGGVAIRGMDHAYVHAKAIVIDGKLAIIGSHNPTSTSLEDNREVSLIIHDVDAIDRVVRTFAGDWSRAVPIFGAEKVDIVS